METTKTGKPGRGGVLARMIRPARRAIRGATLIITFSLSVCLVLAGASHVVMPKNNQREFGMVNPEANGFLGEPEHSIDVLFVGDSLTYSSISPLLIWKEQGFTSYVCATSAQSLPYGRTLLERALQRQRPKVVVIEANSVYAAFSRSDAAWRLAQDAFPVFEYHDRWKKLTSGDFTTAPKSTWTHDLKGHRPNAGIDPADASRHMEPTDEAEKLSDINMLYLRWITELCRARGAEPVVVSTPSVVCWSMKRHNGMELATKELGIRFIDLNVGPDKVDIDWGTDTRDRGDHLNDAGAAKVSRHLGSILKIRYEITSQLTDEQASAWDHACQRNSISA